MTAGVTIAACVRASVRVCVRAHIYSEKGRGGERGRERGEGDREKLEEDNIYKWVEAVSVKDSLNYILESII